MIVLQTNWQHARLVQYLTTGGHAPVAMRWPAVNVRVRDRLRLGELSVWIQIRDKVRKFAKCYSHITKPSKYRTLGFSTYINFLFVSRTARYFQLTVSVIFVFA